MTHTAVPDFAHVVPSVHYRAATSPCVDPPTVVFVHGAADRGAAFAKVGRWLRTANLVRIDRRGYGRSRTVAAHPVTTPSALLAAEVDDVVSVVAACTDSPVIVAGHSVGGVIALGAAARTPAVRGVVAYEPPMAWAPWWPASDHSTPAPDDPAVAMETFLRSMIGDTQWERLGASVQQTRRAEGPALLRDFNVADAAQTLDLGAIGVPVVLGVGTKATRRHRTAAETYAAQLANATVADVHGAGHGGHLTHPEAFAGLVTQCARAAGVDCPPPPVGSAHG